MTTFQGWDRLGTEEPAVEEPAVRIGGMDIINRRKAPDRRRPGLAARTTQALWDRAAADFLKRVTAGCNKGSHRLRVGNVDRLSCFKQLNRLIDTFCHLPPFFGTPVVTHHARKSDVNGIAVNAVGKYPNKFSILGNFDLESPDRLEIVKNWRQRQGMLGFRFTLAEAHQQSWWGDGSLDWLWSACEEEGLPVGLLAGAHLPEFRRVAERHPGLKLHIDHQGRIGRTTDDEAFENLDEMLDLAQFPNVAVKLSGLPSYSNKPYPYRNIHTYIRRIFDAFGPHRCFWGTDITRMPCSYRQCVTMFTEELTWLEARDRELVMGDAICEWIGWKRKK